VGPPTFAEAMPLLLRAEPPARLTIAHVAIEGNSA
jgi:hypothetical protein